MPDEVIYGIDMDNPENAELVKEKWAKEHETVLEPNHLPKSDLEARLAIQKGVDIKNLAVPKNGVAAYLPASAQAGSSDSPVSVNDDGSVLTIDIAAANHDTAPNVIIFRGNNINHEAYVWDDEAQGYVFDGQYDFGDEGGTSPR